MTDRENSALSIEQEPGETRPPQWWRDRGEDPPVSPEEARSRLARLREQEPGETLRAAVLYGPDVEFPNLPNGPYLTGPDVLLAVAHYMDRQDDEAERMAAGSGYRANRDVQAHLREWSRRLRAALEADRNPQETERAVRLCRRRAGDGEECGLPYGHDEPHHPRARVFNPVQFDADLAAMEDDY